ncbi:MAG: multicopper oxidase family protein [Hyphomicrobiaceae bacterium]|nr:multicopper oxidase family protein [Hyphomicrobiaceae bacterium]
MPNITLTRRRFLAGAAAAASAAAGGGLVSALSSAQATSQTVIEPRTTSYDFVGGRPTVNVFSFSEAGPAPLLKVRQGDEIRVRLLNRLKEPTTLHWHGIRLPNAMDGVPFLTQPFVYENETFDYAFSPPDAGSYWYHPHCNSLQQLSYGLSGLLIVEEAKAPGFDADVPMSLRDWRLGDDGQFLKLYNPRQTARAGTHGTVRTVDWRRQPIYDVPAGGLVRVRLVVVDVTRVYKLAVDGAPAIIIALDGNPLPAPVPLETFAVAPGQRMDIVVRMPDDEGQQIAILDHSSAPTVPLARLRSVGASRRRDLRDVAALPPNPFPELDLSAAIPLSLEFQATAEQLPKSRICGDLGYSFWAINRKVWTGSSADPGAPMAELKLGRTYLLNLYNRTPHPHPIHLHGMSFKLLKSDRRTLPEVWTDTALIVPDEHVQVALVADNPGDWLLHCHIIEHQETGMTGFIRVT